MPKGRIHDLPVNEDVNADKARAAAGGGVKVTSYSINGSGLDDGTTLESRDLTTDDADTSGDGRAGTVLEEIEVEKEVDRTSVPLL